MAVFNGKDYEGEEPKETEQVLEAKDIQEALDELNAEIDDDVDDTVGMCSECKNIQPDQYMLRSPFFGSGGPVPCKFCGAPTIIVRQRFVDQHFKDRLDQMRGIGSSRGVPGVDG